MADIQAGFNIQLPPTLFNDGVKRPPPRPSQEEKPKEEK